MKKAAKLAIVATGAAMGAGMGVAAGVIASQIHRKSRESELTGDVVLITGGSRGLGLALARRFAREGCRIAICARDEQELTRAREDLTRRGAGVFTGVCDVTSRSEVERFIRDVTAHYGRVDILVANAGQIQVGPLESMTVEDFEQSMNVMFWGTVYPTLALLPQFLERNRGRIVHITSIGGKVAVPHLLPYCSAKYAATGFSEGLHSELAHTGIKVTTIVPGLMRTGSYNAAQFKGDHAAESAWFSVSSSLPGFSMDAARAARQIVNAVKRGDSEKVLTVQASLLAALHGLAPGITQSVLGRVASLVLPAPDCNKLSRPGWDLPSLQSPKMRGLLFFGRMAARRLNQKTA